MGRKDRLRPLLAVLALLLLIIYLAHPLTPLELLLARVHEEEFALENGGLEGDYYRYYPYTEERFYISRGRGTSHIYHDERLNEEPLLPGRTLTLLFFVEIVHVPFSYYRQDLDQRFVYLRLNISNIPRNARIIDIRMHYSLEGSIGDFALLKEFVYPGAMGVLDESDLAKIMQGYPRSTLDPYGNLRIRVNPFWDNFSDFPITCVASAEPIPIKNYLIFSASGPTSIEGFYVDKFIADSMVAGKGGLTGNITKAAPLNEFNKKLTKTRLEEERRELISGKGTITLPPEIVYVAQNALALGRKQLHLALIPRGYLLPPLPPVILENKFIFHDLRFVIRYAVYGERPYEATTTTTATTIVATIPSPLELSSIEETADKPAWPLIASILCLILAIALGRRGRR
ncbi:MAG: hypothetical protein QXS76_00240 [Candidatus Bathyarchaeia archaeon]